MKSRWSLLVIAGVAVAAVLAYVVGQSAAQLRGLLSSSTSAAVPVSASGHAESAETSESPAASVAPAATDPTITDAADEEAGTSSDAFFEESSSDAPAGPPTGEEFARLLEEGLIEDADPQAVEEYLRALREQGAPP